MTKRTRADDDPVMTFATRAAFAKWLAAHHATSSGIWMRIAKKGAEAPSVSYEDALRVALAYGWIDGQKRADDAMWWLQRFTKRGVRSVWSKINRATATDLVACGEMKPSGLAEVERAKSDGRWGAAYDSPKSSSAPDDLVAALAKNARAKRFYDALDATNRYAITWRIHQAKRAETRAKRIAVFVAMCARGETLHEPRATRGRTRR